VARYLIVANQTLGGEQLVARIDEWRSRADGPLAVYLAVPVTDTEGTHQWDYPPIDRAIPDAHEIARTLAEARLAHELARLRSLGVDAAGEVVDANPVQHVRALAGRQHFDEVVVSTLPRRLSRWLRTDLPHRLSRALSVPVSQLEGSAGPSI
jgi:hypothetical protein